MQQASAIITTYKNSIKSANNDDLKQLVTNLANALPHVSIGIECYRKQVQTFHMVAGNCKNGVDSLSNIFNTVSNQIRPNHGCTVNVSIMDLIFFVVWEIEF